MAHTKLIMKRIILYTDILRPGSWINENIEIIKNLFSYQLNYLGYEVVSVLEAGFKIEQFFLYNQNISSIQDFAKLTKSQKEQLWIDANTKPIHNQAITYFTSFFRNCIGIAYHSSEAINNMLDSANITYLDGFETSFRYLSDTYLAFRTNNNTIANVLLNNYAIDEHKLYMQANYLKALYIRNSTNIQKINNNSCLIICQTPLDIVLIKKNGEVNSLLNYIDEITNLAKSYHTIYYKLHPKSPSWYNKKLTTFFKTITNARPVNDDMYELLANPNIIKLCGINSGSLYEAKYFGKATLFLGEPVFHYSFSGNSYTKQNYIMLNDNALLFNLSFWQHILENKTDILDQQLVFNNSQDLLRNVFNISSSYTLSSFLNFKKIEKNLLINHIKKLIKKIF